MIREYPGRKVAIGRIPAVGRVPAVGRIPIPVAPKNGKLNVILDTNIFVSALKSESLGFKDGASYLVVEELRKESFNLIQPYDLYEEYKHEMYRLTEKGELVKSAVEILLALIDSRRITSRSFINPAIIPVDPDDIAVFNTSMIEEVDYVVSTDYRDLHKKEIRGKPSQLKVINPNKLLTKLKVPN